MSAGILQSNASTRAEWLDELRAMLALGWPLVLTNLAQIALTTTDVIVLGHLGAQALAASTLSANLYFAVVIFGIGLVSATAPMMAEAFGRKLKAVRDVRRTFRQGLWASALISIPAMVLLWHTEAVLLLLQQEPQLAADAQTLMRALQWSFLPTLGFVVLRSFVAALERPMWALAVTGAAILFNIAANVVLVFGHLGFPAMGLRGSGIATTLSSFFMFGGLALVVAFSRKFRRYALFGHFWRPDWPRLAALWKLGLPIGAAMAFEITIFNAAAFLMGQFGANALAAHAIALQIASVSFMVPLGLGQAATVRVGRALGARDRDGITRAGWTAFALAMAFMAAMSGVMLLMPRPLIGIFVALGDMANAEVVALAAGFLFCAAVFQLADGAQAVGAGMLRGLQDTSVPMLFAATGYWIIGMPLCLLFAFTLGFGGLGIWIGLALSLAIVACAMIWRWSWRARLKLVPIPQ